MIDFKASTITLGGNPSKITNWSVWFRTPFGLFTDLDDAVQRLEEADMDPDLLIEPVSVAHAEDGSYEIKQ